MKSIITINLINLGLLFSIIICKRLKGGGRCGK